MPATRSVIISLCVPVVLCTLAAAWGAPPDRGRESRDADPRSREVGERLHERRLHLLTERARIWQKIREYEKAGKPVPPSLRDELDKVEAQLDSMGRRTRATERGQDDPRIDLSEIKAKLRQACREQLKKDPEAAAARKAAELFEKVKSERNVRELYEALEILRHHRPKTGIPMLLYYMIDHQYNLELARLNVYGQVLQLLGGERVAGERVAFGRVYPEFRVFRGRYEDREEIKRLAELHLKDLDNRTTNMEKMTPAQLREITRVLEWLSEHSGGGLTWPNRNDRITAFNVHYTVVFSLRPSGASVRNPRWFEEDLSPALVPYLLEYAGYAVPQGAGAKAPADKGEPEGDPHIQREPILPYWTIQLLADLRKRGDAPQLHHLAADLAQPARVRLVCLLAQQIAGEDMQDKHLVRIIDEEKALDIRLGAIVALRYCTDRKAAFRKAVSLLKDPEGEVVGAAVSAMQGLSPRDSIEPLAELINRPSPPEAGIWFAFPTLGMARSDKAIRVMAEYLRDASQDPDERKCLRESVGNFCRAVGLISSFYEDLSPKEAAAQALRDWKAGKGNRHLRY